MLLKINVWISWNGYKQGAYSGISFPYTALQPSIKTKAVYNNIQDVYRELLKLSVDAEEKGFNVGESLYMQSFHFVDHSLLVDKECQTRIKEYQFCKNFAVAPYPSLYQTPAHIIDDFMTIDEEFNACIARKNKEKQNA